MHMIKNHYKIKCFIDYYSNIATCSLKNKDFSALRKYYNFSKNTVM